MTIDDTPAPTAAGASACDPVGGSGASWEMVDEGWGRKAVDFATLSEPANCREYVAIHHRLGVSGGDRLLDVACGSGLAVELARARGLAVCPGGTGAVYGGQSVVSRSVRRR